MTQSGLSADTQALMAFESQKKSSGVAYLLWFFVGQFGAHRFYLGSTGLGAVQLILGLLGWATVWFALGFLFLIPLWIWLFVDLFLIPGLAERRNQRLMERLNMGAPRRESAAEELSKYAALRDSGAITGEEYEAQKARLLV
ncbi:MAG: NINE protein [Brevundimonas sp.]|uniref:NINE protein n=1 Tax=Brevundimonas sp. TaxID=1871086 RepID=UPI0027348795|nr:NINE protein [Brevundimonas sp.]MDP3404471.1 NINE protein [Brevundimonas sp.]